MILFSGAGIPRVVRWYYGVDAPVQPQPEPGKQLYAGL